MIVAALVLYAAVSAPVRIAEPVEVSAPAEIAASWTSFDLAPLAAGEIEVLPPADMRFEQARVDVLERQGKRWVWSQAGAYRRGARVAASDRERALLVRVRGDSFFYWAELPASRTAAAHLKRYRNVNVIADDGADGVDVLYVAGEALPRTATDRRFRFVPADAAIVCSTSASGATCVAAPANLPEVHVTRSGSVRVLRSEPQRDDTFALLRKGNVALRPRKIEINTAHAGAWIALTVAEPAFNWDTAVVQRSGSELADSRIAGAQLTPIPAFSELAAVRERGVVVRPWIERRPLPDGPAMLLVFPADSREIPIATAERNGDGAFALPTLGAGEYVAKLLSPFTASDIVTLSASTTTPVDLSFPAGPTIRGRVVKTFGGTAADDVIVEWAVITNMEEALKADLLDRVRFTTADASGAFALVASQPGTYRLRARWGQASAEREVTVDRDTHELDLGDIVLGRGATLRGAIAPCRNAEALLLPVPDLSKPLVVGFRELRRAPVAPDGTFVAEGLQPGLWSVLVKCDGAPVEVAPETFPVTDAADVVLKFACAACPSH